MQDKIQEIMGLVREMGDAEFYAGSHIKDAAMHDTKALEASKLEVLIESKLRELVREPLDHEKLIDAARYHHIPERQTRAFIIGARFAESGNITNTGGVE